MKDEKYQPQYMHLRYGILLTDHEQNRFIIAAADEIADPLIIHEKLAPGVKLRYQYLRYTLYTHAMTKNEADAILAFMKEEKRASARALLRRCFRDDAPAWGYKEVGEAVLDDMIPDDWYDCWKEMEAAVTTAWPQGYHEEEVRVNDGW